MTETVPSPATSDLPAGSAREECDDDARTAALLRALRPVDARRVPPPEGLWGRISDALREETAVTGGEGVGTVVEYCIDADDVVVSVGADWVEFASENEARDLAIAPTGRTLWDAIGDDALRELWVETVRRVRGAGRAVTVPFRCDGPNTRRWFEMTLTPSPSGAVHFRSELVFEMSRPELALLLREVERDPDADPVEICSWCGEAEDDGEWRPVEELLARARLLEREPPPPVRHGICPGCVEVMATTSAARTG